MIDEKREIAKDWELRHYGECATVENLRELGELLGVEEEKLAMLKFRHPFPIWLQDIVTRYGLKIR